MTHEFTKKIFDILLSEYGDNADDIFDKSSLLQYINIKTKSASRGSKSRGSFANLYAIYVLVEDYIKNGFVESENYTKYEGAKFARLLHRQRELPFGSKLQNHALNHRMNEEFKKYFSQVEYIPILRNPGTNRYWFNENLIKIKLAKKTYNIAHSIIKIIDAYMGAKRSAFESFIRSCEELKNISTKDTKTIEVFILSLLAPNVDARIFEIVSYSILKNSYRDQSIYFGFELESVQEENLKLYKTGRTNANDGGIDFVMRPLGRFFQVTETVDVKKYFLDIDKIEHYPITFIIKSEEAIETLRRMLKEGAFKQYVVGKIVEKYMECVEEIINIPELKSRLAKVIKAGYLQAVLEEVIKQSKVEFNYEEDDPDTEGSQAD